MVQIEDFDALIFYKSVSFHFPFSCLDWFRADNVHSQ